MIRSAVRHVAASCVLVALAVAAPAAADDVTVMTSGAFTAAYLELAPRFERATGHTLVIRGVCAECNAAFAAKRRLVM